MLSVVQSVAVIVATLVSAYAVAVAEVGGRRAARRARGERLLDAVLRLAEAARPGQEPADAVPLDIARRRLRAELAVTGIKGFESTEIMSRPRLEPKSIVDQSEPRSSGLRRHSTTSLPGR